MNSKIIYIILALVLLGAIGVSVYALRGTKVTETAELPVVEKPVTEKQIGYIKSVYTKGNKEYLDIDYIQWLTGEEGIDAAIEDEECTRREDCLPNGFYIRNQNPKIRTFEISSNVEVRMQTLSWAPDGNFNFNESISYERFKDVFSRNVRSLQELLYNITIQNSVITKIVQQYVP